MTPTPNPSAPPPAWRVTSQLHTTRATEGGRFQTGWVVSFRTAAGHDGEVFVPDAQYTPDYVRAQISAYQPVIDSVGTLQG